MSKLKLMQLIVCMWHLDAISNNLQSFQKKADSLFRLKEYEKSAMMYEKCVFISINDSVKSYFLLRKALCYSHNNNFEKAYNTLERTNISIETLSDSLQNEIYFQKILNAYLDEKFDLVLLHSKYDTLLPMSVNSSRIRILRILALNELGSYYDAKMEYIIYCRSINMDSTEAIVKAEKLYGKNSLPVFKDVEKAKKMSLFLPASGLLYAKRPKEAFVNISMQVLGIGIFATSIFTGYYFTSIVVGYTIFQKFYEGAVRRSERVTLIYNYKISSEYNKKLKQELIK